MCRMTLRPMRRIAEVATDIGGTNIDFRLLEERYKLAERECALEGKLKCIENGVYAKYPDAHMARLVVGDILRIDKCTTLQRRSTLMRMKERALKVLDIVDREVVAEQFEMKLEMYEIKKSLIVNEAKIREQVRKRRSTDTQEISPKLARK
ncbi:hypothetical protein PRIPAC_97383 [Pristionchus pacificus]|uniref:Uncharacterized protein n=1 Tax=Pristionchus pacificus TaxID=54126 RepID=A0A2A6D2Y4_PRIPA|nr:hypothetical protein PRIPAC_97383 [Pristionchus pacificus]|eukprot:PDM84765.1 hypothetical protein PRIPAC_33788 [Pristionchus pacificus]